MSSPGEEVQGLCQSLGVRNPVLRVHMHAEQDFKEPAVRLRDIASQSRTSPSGVAPPPTPPSSFELPGYSWGTSGAFGVTMGGRPPIVGADAWKYSRVSPTAKVGTESIAVRF